MKKNIYIILITFVLITVIVIGIGKTILSGLSGMGSPTGGGRTNDPYFITTEPVTVKKIVVPKGTKLTYGEYSSIVGQQNKIMDEKKLIAIELLEGKTINWGGVPVNMIVKFFNSEMRGYSVYADFNKLSDDKKTNFSELWQNCGSNDLGVLVKNTNDWTFNKNNIIDISDCGVNNQRYFKENIKQQKFLDDLYNALKIVK